MEFFGLPHRPPFVFVRQLTRCENGTAVGETWFDETHPMFAGHFPGNPLVPGVILTEALAQMAGIAAASGHAASEEVGPRFLLSAIRQMKFPAAARPNENIGLTASKIAEAGVLLQFDVQATVGDRVVAVGQIVLSRVEADKS